MEVGRLLTQNIDLFDVWWIFSATIWICNWRVFGCAPEKGTISKRKASLPSSIFHGRSITVDHDAEVLPPEAVALCRSKSPDAFIMLDAAHGFFGSLAAAQIWWVFTPPPYTQMLRFSFPPWLMVTDLHLRITAEVNRAQTGLSCGCSSDQLSLGRKKRMETGDIWETTLGLGCWIFLLSIFCSVLSDSLKKTRVFFKLYFSAVYSLCELAVSNECVYVCRCEGMWKRCR